MNIIKKFEENPCSSENALANQFNALESAFRKIYKSRKVMIVAHRHFEIQLKKTYKFKAESSKNFRKFSYYGLKKVVSRNFMLSLSF